MSRIVPLVLVFSTSGCEMLGDLGEPAGGGKIDVEVVMRDGVPEISWDRGDVHLIEVLECETECQCLEGFYVANGQIVWTVGSDTSVALGYDEVMEPPLQSPILYGDEEVPGDQLDLEAYALEPGVTYGVTVKLLDKHNGRTRRTGCTWFVME